MNITYKCLKCGHLFLHVKGDFVHDRTVVRCTKCNSILVVSVKKL